MTYVKPPKLNKGDAVAVVAPSWGGPGLFPHVQEEGLKVLRRWGLDVCEMPSSKQSPDYLWANPEFRANDINKALEDRGIKAIFSSIGGDDSVRILPFLDQELVRDNPKILLGFSDTTTLHVFFALSGVTSFYGPSIMAGFSQMDNLPHDFRDHVRDMLFKKEEQYIYQGYGVYCEGYPDWSVPANTGKTNELHTTPGWEFLQGEGKASGKLFGGCVEVLEFLKGTRYWPEVDFWDKKILFLETSEDKPSVKQIRDYLRNYGMQGVLGSISALLFGRLRGYNDNEKKEFKRILEQIVSNEFGRPSLPIVLDMDFGHTDPQLVLPLGVEAVVDCDSGSFYLAEPWLS